MTDSALIRCVYDGEAFKPDGRFHSRHATEHFGAGEIVMLSVVNERSWRSHKHYFASIQEAWSNLPESAALEPWAQSSEHLRKFALIKTGYHDSATVVLASKAEAARVAAFMRPAAGYDIITAVDCVVTRYTAQSQSMKAMGATEFQRSKVAVLDYLAGLIGVETGQLGRVQ